MSLIAFCALFAAIGSGCVPGGSDEFTKPVAATPAGSDPVVLNGAGGKVANPATETMTKTEPASAGGAPGKTIASDTSGPAPGIHLLPAAPLAPLPETPAVAAVAPDPSGGNITKNAAGYPNVNDPPKEPASKLLPEDERQRVISELEAMRMKDDSGAKPAAGSQVVKKSASKVKTVKCPDGTTAVSCTQ